MINGWWADVTEHGDVVCGAGEVWFLPDGDVSQAVRVGQGYFPRALDGHRAVYNDSDGEHDIGTRLLDGTQPGPIIAPSYGRYAGSRTGRWLGLLQGGPIYLRLHDSDGRVLREWTGVGSPDMSPSGRVAYADRYFEQVHTLFVLEPGANKPVPVTTDTIIEVSICDSALCWAVDDHRRVFGKIGDGEAEEWTVDGWEAPMVCDSPDGPWVLSMTQTGAVFRPAGSRVGHRWDGEWFNPRARWVDAAGCFVLAGRVSGGDGVLVRRVRLTDARVPLVSAPPPPPTPPQEPEGIMIRSFERPMWVAPFFSYSEKYGGWDVPVERYAGNAVTLVEREGDPSVLLRELQRAVRLSLPLIVQADRQPIPPEYLNLTVAWWVAGARLGELGEAVSRATVQPEKPIIAYLDADEWPTQKPAWVGGRVWPSIPAYRRAGEALSVFRARLESQLARVSTYGQPIVLTPRFDDPDQDGSGWALEATLECMPLYEQWVRDFQIVGFMPFADRRGHGISHHVVLWHWARAFLFAAPSGRPNRSDYWRPHGSRPSDVLRNKLGQSRAAVVLEPWLRERLLRPALLDALDADGGQGTDDDTDTHPPDPPDDPLDFDGLYVVTQTRRELYPHVADDEPLPGLREGFRITRRVAERLADRGFGLVEAKPGSDNQVDGYVSDVVALPDGRHWDVLGSAGERNTAAWNAVPQYGEDGTDYWAAIRPRWRPVR